MIIWASGIILTENEHRCLLHIVPESEQWLRDAIIEKARLRRDALINEWRPKLYADESVTELPANADDIAQLIIARPDYTTRVAREPITEADRPSAAKYAKTTRAGRTVTLFADGLEIDDAAANCILAYVQDLEEWVLGAMLGQINRGKKKMISKYHPIILADSSVTSMPATGDGLIEMIVARSDYTREG